MTSRSTSRPWIVRRETISIPASEHSILEWLESLADGKDPEGNSVEEVCLVPVVPRTPPTAVTFWDKNYGEYYSEYAADSSGYLEIVDPDEFTIQNYELAKNQWPLAKSYSTTVWLRPTFLVYTVYWPHYDRHVHLCAEAKVIKRFGIQSRGHKEAQA